MTRDEILRRFPNASADTLKINADDPGLCAAQPERPARMPLERAAPGKEKGGDGIVAGARFRVQFTVFSVSPRDWDNQFCKPLQDCLIEAGIIPDDNWRVLEGSVISKKAKSKAEERTEITIEKL
jgi:Holliday junction resolvase RusA-like endonuclease